jgi:hypothetical protein
MFQDKSRMIKKIKVTLLTVLGKTSGPVFIYLGYQVR